MKKFSHSILLAIVVLAVFGFWAIKQLVVRPVADREHPPDAPSAQRNGPMPEQTMDSVRARIDDLRRAVQNDPDNPELLIALGNIFFDAGMPEQAIEYYDRVLSLQPENTNTMVDKATMLRSLGRAPEAIQLLERALTINPGHEQALFNMGVIFSTDLKDDSSAIRAWKLYLTAHATAPQAAAVRQEIDRLERVGTADSAK